MRRPESFRCGPGCSKCCVARITVWRVEADHISAKTMIGTRDSGPFDSPTLAQGRPGIRSAAFEDHNESSESRIPNPESRKDACVFLDKENRCSIYDARPVVCRLWGAPLLIPKGYEGEWGIRDSSAAPSHGGTVICCDLNFTDTRGLGDLADSDIINVETALTSLAAINHVYCSTAGLDPEERIPLSTVA